jgi:MshEN domain
MPLDVYRDWLKITETARPLNHYQLLRLKLFEDNPAKVREHYRAMNSHVRKFAAGEFAKQSQDLLNELARAMLCLTDSQRKAEYDVTLGRKDAKVGTKGRTFEQILLATKVVDQSALDKARNFAKAIGVDVRDALVQQKLAKYDEVLPAYAESIGLPYLDLTDVPLNPQLIAGVPPMMARQHSCVPVLVDGKELLMASPNPLDPNVEEELRLRFSMSVRTVLCSPANINDVIAKHIPRDAAAEPAPVQAAAVAAPVAAPAAAAPAVKPTGPMTDEEKKQRRDLSIIATFGTGMVLTNVLIWGLGWKTIGSVLLAGIIGFLIGAAAGGITWKVKSR